MTWFALLTTVSGHFRAGAALLCFFWLSVGMPRRRRANQASGAHVSLDPAAGLTPVVASRRHELYARFCRWIEDELKCEFAQVCAPSGLLLSTALVGYGKSLFYSGQPKYVFSESINAVSDQFKHLRAHFVAAWGILSRWEEEEPGERSMVMPESLLRAAVTLSLLWRWPHFTGFLPLGFHALLRPSEILRLRRRDLIYQGICALMLRLLSSVYWCSLRPLPPPPAALRLQPFCASPPLGCRLQYPRRTGD